MKFIHLYYYANCRRPSKKRPLCITLCFILTLKSRMNENYLTLSFNLFWSFIVVSPILAVDFNFIIIIIIFMLGLKVIKI